MALTDLERAWAELEAYVQSQPNHGSRQLALKMLEIKARNAIDESLPERMLRLYGVQLSDDLRAAARDELTDHGGDSLAPAMSDAPGGRSHETTEEVTDGIRIEGQLVGRR